MYTSLIERIKRHITESKLAATKFELIYKDQSASISLKTDAVMGLTALTEIHVALYNALNHEESRRLAVNAAIEIISISDGLPKDRYDLLDHLFLVRSLSLSHPVRCSDFDVGVLEDRQRSAATRTSSLTWREC